MHRAWFGFDRYSYGARLLPALFTVLPVVITAMIIYPTLYNGIGTTIASLAVACGALFFATNVIRARGRIIENKLVEKWGGMATTVMLRHCDDTLDPQTTKRYHRFLSEKIPGLRLPDRQHEALDPVDADKSYRSAVKWLLEVTRDSSSFPIIFSENVSYGFRRNLFGAKNAGIGLILMCLLTVIGVNVGHYPGIRQDPAAQGLLVAFLLVSLFCWMVFVTEKWVMDASVAYARALLSACDAIPPSDDATTGKGKIIAP